MKDADLSNRDALTRSTVRLALDVAAQDRHWHAELDALYADMTAHANEPRPKPQLFPTRKLLKLAQSVALGGAVAAVGSGCECDGMVVDPVPPDAGTDSGDGRRSRARSTPACPTRATDGRVRRRHGRGDGGGSGAHRRRDGRRLRRRERRRASWSIRPPFGRGA